MLQGGVGGGGGAADDWLQISALLWPAVGVWGL